MADGLLNKASIILTPTAYKAGTLYNVAPVVEPYEDFDFARASVASRVNSSGLVEMVGRSFGSELVIDGNFPNGDNWNEGSSWTISDNKATATSNGYLIQSNVIPSSSTDTYKLTYTISNSNDANLKLAGGSNPFGTKNIPDEDGTYTLYLVANGTTARNLQFLSNGFRGDISNVSLKQLIDTNNIPRISYDSNGANGHILLEPTSTNFLPYSNDFSQSNWVKQTNITATYNTTETLSPDGTYNATKLVGDGTDGIFDSSLSITGDVTRSVYLKSVSGTVTLKLKDSNINIGIETLTVTTEWQRFHLSGDNGSSLQGIFIFDIPASGVYIFGAQVENLPYPTSYIPTLTGSTETRATETATGAGSADLINSTEGVLYGEIAVLEGQTNINRYISINNGTDDNFVSVHFRNNTNNQIRAIVRVSNSNQCDFTYNPSGSTSFAKFAFKWKANDFALWVNGVEIGSDTSGSTFSANTLNNISFDSGQGGDDFYGKVKALAVFNEALSDAELNNLTG